MLSTGKPWVAPYTHPFFEVAHDALEKGFGKRAVFIREGGSIPFVTQMYDTFKVPCMLLGFGLPDENAHAPDEHIALENYFGGIKAVANFYQGLGEALSRTGFSLSGFDFCPCRKIQKRQAEARPTTWRVAWRPRANSSSVDSPRR